MRSEFPYKQQFCDYLKVVKGYSIHTQHSYPKDLEQFFTFLGQFSDNPSVHDVESKSVKLWVRSLAEDGLQAKSIHRKISSVRTYLRFLAKNRFLKEPVSLDISLPKIRKAIPKFIKVSEINQLLDYYAAAADDFESVRNYAILATFYHTGIRRAELINLKDSNISLKQRELKVLGKGNKERIIPFGVELEQILQNFKNHRNNESIVAVQFFTDINGKPLKERWLYGLINDMLAVTNAGKKSPHILRHSFATHLLQNGADINAIKELLGHTGLTATQLYAHNDIKQLKEIYKQTHPLS